MIANQERTFLQLFYFFMIVYVDNIQPSKYISNQQVVGKEELE